MASILVYPEHPREYLHDSGSNLVDRGWKWKFGLPDVGQLSSNSCGAMPFRDALSGINAKKCIRGEDWEWILNWTFDRNGLPGSLITQNWPGLGAMPQLSRGPTKEQITRFGECLSSLCAVWRSDFQFEAKGLSSLQDAQNELLSQLDPIETLDTGLSTRVLDIKQMENFFLDMSKFKCTVMDCGTIMEDGGSGGGATLYDWYYSYGQAPEQQSDFLSALWLRQPNSLYINWNNPDRPIQFQVFFIALVGCYVRDGSGWKPDRYVLVDFLNGPVSITQRFNTEYRFTKLTTWGGITAANNVAAIIGENPRPDPQPGETVRFTVQLLNVYAVAWPSYLEL